MADGWQAPAAPGWRPARPTESGLLKAAKILLLVGWVRSAVGAVFLVLIGGVFVLVFGELAKTCPEAEAASAQPRQGWPQQPPQVR